MSLKNRKLPLILLIILCCMAVTYKSYAAVSFNKNEASDTQSIYIAGNPDRFPIEYYDAYSNTYRGALPALMEKVSEETGLEFSYVYAGKTDRRKELGKNNQVKMLFAFSDEPDLLKSAAYKTKVFSTESNNAPLDIYCLFTSAAKRNEITMISKALSSLSAEEMAVLFLNAARETDNTPKRRTVRMLIIGLAVLLVSAMCLLFLYLRNRDELRKSALIDPLTMIDNKDGFLQKYNTQLNENERPLYLLVYIGFDVGQISRLYGSGEANCILRRTAKILSNEKKMCKLYARIDDGAFAAAFLGEDAVQAESSVRTLLQKLNNSAEKNGRKVCFQAGAYILGMGDYDCEAAIENAKQAYLAAVEMSEPLVFASESILKRQKTKADIRRQLSEKEFDMSEFVPYVQFIFDAKTHHICGGELLSRWQNRQHGLLRPNMYLSDAAQLGIIAQIDLKMFEEACNLLSVWTREELPYFLTCNLSRATLSNEKSIDAIIAAAKNYKFPSERLFLEITEDTLEENKEAIKKSIAKLKKEGFHTALDDFSSGYTTVTNLCEYEVDLVKIDRKLLLFATEDTRAQQLLNEIISLAHALQIKVVGEGVESAKQSKLLSESNCDYLQGYLFAKPVPARETRFFIKRFQKKVFNIKEGNELLNDENNEKNEKYVEEPTQKCGELLRIQYGNYCLDLPETVDIDALSAILKSLLENK